MNSLINEDFLRAFRALPDEVKTQARRGYRLWLEDPYHPGLHFKKIQGSDSLYSVRIGIGWRALGLLDGDTITWFWIGSHADYDRLIG